MQVTPTNSNPVPAPTPDRLPTAPPPAAEGDRFVSRENSFQQHLKQAASINRLRATYYAAQTDHRSWFLSAALVSIETLSRPLAQTFDQRAKPFQRQGIPIVQHDLVPMAPLPPASTPPTYRHQASPDDHARLSQWIKDYRSDVLRFLKNHQFQAIADGTAALLVQIEQLEKESQSHFAMCKHLVESIGYAALHAPQYQATSAGATRQLSADLIRAQLPALWLAPVVDRQAQRFHQQGVGIVVNDVPLIPFLKEWQDGRRP